jgi:predicted nucleic acid-binding protein
MSKKYVIYLDVCCLNRPYDDWTRSRIRLEAEAILAIMALCQSGNCYLLNSTALESEIDRTPNRTRVEQVMESLSVSQSKIFVTEIITQRAIELTTFSFKFYDALHLACAESGNADVFLTTDARLLRKAGNYRNNLTIKVANPVLWLMEITNVLE